MIQLNLLTDFVQTEPRFTLACGECPQARMEHFGVTALSDTELMAMLLQGAGIRPEKALVMAARMIAEAGSLAGLATWVAADYRRMKGIGRAKALQLATLTEIARRMMTTRAETPLLNRPDLTAAYMAPVTTGLEIEKFWVLCLNRKNRLLRRVEVTSGIATAALAHPREVFRAAIREASVAVVCVHNHPSGDPAPSAADIHLTRQLKEAARIVDIEIMDHVIIGRVGADPLGLGHYSFRAAGLL